MYEKQTSVEPDKAVTARIRGKNPSSGLFAFCLLTFLAGLILPLKMQFCRAAEHIGNTGPSTRTEELWDPNRYISIDEVKPGMEAYCLTVYKGTEIEKFDLEVLSVVRDIWPGRDAILVQGTDERFIHTGPVGGCSGSPVYIDGRLAGALAFGWLFSKDPLYGVTPIEEMLRVGRNSNSESTGPDAEPMAFAFDFSGPVNLADAYRQITEKHSPQNDSLSMPRPLPCPLVASGLPKKAVAELDSLVRPLGLVAVSGVSGGTNDTQGRQVQLLPGACLSVALVTGDITLDVIGTVTEVVGDKVYGFGHRFLGYGPVDLPLATGHVHTVVSSLVRSFKFSTSLEIVGALKADESTAIYGQIGAKARTFPLRITVDRYNDSQRRVYNCQVADNRRLTAILLYISLYATAYMRGSLPPDHTLEYKVAIELADAKPIVFENVSTGKGLREMLMEGVTPVAILMNNPYGKTYVKSVDYDIRILPKNTASHIWSVDLSDSKIKAGEQFDVSVVVESRLGRKKKYQYNMKIPENTPPGIYELIVCGGGGYLEFLGRVVPHRFTPENLTTLIEAMNNVLQIRRDRLYCLLVLPASGVTLARAELPDLPGTKALVLQDGKRTLPSRPYPRWLEESLRVGVVVADTRVMHITVEE